jgi:hypothetical protein
MKKGRWYNGVVILCPCGGCEGALTRIVETRCHQGVAYRTRVCSINKLHRFTTAELIVGGGQLAFNAMIHSAKRFRGKA